MELAWFLLGLSAGAVLAIFLLLLVGAFDPWTVDA